MLFVGNPLSGDELKDLYDKTVRSNINNFALCIVNKKSEVVWSWRMWRL